MAVGAEAEPKDKKYHGKGKGKKRAGVAAASTRAGVPPYMPMKLPLFREAYLKAMMVGLDAANNILPFPLCANPKLPLATTVAIFKVTLDSPSIVTKDKVQVAEAGKYLAEKLATMAVLVDKRTPAVVAFFDAMPHGRGGRWRGPGKTLLFDITNRLAKESH